MSKLSLLFLFGFTIRSINTACSQDTPNLPNESSAEMMTQAEKEALRQYGPLVVKKLSVNILIDSAGFFDVEENYEVYFNEERHGILRFLKLKYLLDRHRNCCYEIFTSEFWRKWWK